MFTIPIQEGSSVALPAVDAHVGRAYRARIVRVPDEVEGVVVSVGANDFTAEQIPGGEWIVTLPPSLFTTAGQKFAYEIDGYIEDECVYLGGGTVFVS